ncbi:GNAT family N-acetyltransferase [Saccharothrix violaceirubra]|uniref:Ribosomal protein S18 acetylase RimI-like enzyme n=1 Tax=Saccharothrix violaceirubra TaxID=413306 RepID=A0A7W7SZ99_9PSEU|nr:GNAT family N-acetyltransferase [Saccharothrix violaceirubra]MBB4963595.1 ribosomal protein S18 acetylase RimI-like enzyme [Saccharothrix violaceirubra]
MITESTSAGLLADADELADLLLTVVAGGSSVGFLATLTHAEAVTWWRGLAAPLANGALTLWVARAEGRIVGTVQLRHGTMPNGTHRAEVAKLMVAPSARGWGVGRRLLDTAERGAARLGRTLLVLDTETGSPAENLYRSAGWTEVGRIPDFAADPGGALRPTTLFYKLATAGTPPTVP